jgi:hypothetical protein
MIQIFTSRIPKHEKSQFMGPKSLIFSQKKGSGSGSGSSVSKHLKPTQLYIKKPQNPNKRTHPASARHMNYLSPTGHPTKKKHSL